MAEPLNLIDLPAYVILDILRYLDATSLYQLGRVSTYFDEIIKSDGLLWRRIDARRAPNNVDKLSYCLERCHKRTHTFLTRGDYFMKSLISEDYFDTMKSFTNLVILAVENQKIDGSKYRAYLFPPQLHELSLKKTRITNGSHFFRCSSDKLLKLRVLVLDECMWLTSNSFMPISKYVSLEILSVYKCRNIENSIAYLSLSGLSGFKQLKIFDGRLSHLGNTLIRSIYRSPNLLAIYLQNEDITYKLDYYKRKLKIAKGASVCDFWVDDAEFNENDMLMNEENGLNYGGASDVDDRGLLDYVSAYSKHQEAPWPESVLYLDPYNPCTCGVEEKPKNLKDKPDKDKPTNKSPKNGNDSDDDDNDQGGGGDLTQKLANKVLRLSRIVRLCQASNTCNRGLFNPQRSGIMLSLDDINGDIYYQRLTSSPEPRPHEPDIPKSGVYEVMVEAYMPSASSDNGETGNQVGNGERPVVRICTGANQRSGEATTSGRRRVRSTMSEPGPSGVNEPQAKKMKNDDGTNSDSDEEIYVRRHLERPPTPHPDVNSPPPEKREAYRRIYFGNCPLVQIENLVDIRKEVPVPLRRLSLRGFQKITNAGLDYIKDIELDLLDLTYTSVTEEAINNYLVDHPFCRIVHEQFCVCPPNLHF